jgi:hypothetical protein
MNTTVQWDWSISLGAILNLVVFIVSGIGIYVKIEKRLTRIETILEMTTAMRLAGRARKGDADLPTTL